MNISVYSPAAYGCQSFQQRVKQSHTRLSSVTFGNNSNEPEFKFGDIVKAGQAGIDNGLYNPYPEGQHFLIKANWKNTQWQLNPNEYRVVACDSNGTVGDGETPIVVNFKGQPFTKVTVNS